MFSMSKCAASSARRGRNANEDVKIAAAKYLAIHSMGTYLEAVRDLKSIDDELSLVADVQRALLEDGGDPSTWQADALLDERLRVASRGKFAAEQ
jgi:hypothetical protein